MSDRVDLESLSAAHAAHLRVKGEARITVELSKFITSLKSTFVLIKFVHLKGTPRFHENESQGL